MSLLAYVQNQPGDNPLDTAKYWQLEQIGSACFIAIASGFKSAALGRVHSYPFNDMARQELAEAMIEALLDGHRSDRWTLSIFCIAPDGKELWIDHHLEHVKQLFRDAMSAKKASVKRQRELSAQINAADTIEAVQAVVWPAGAAGATGA